MEFGIRVPWVTMVAHGFCDITWITDLLHFEMIWGKFYFRRGIDTRYVVQVDFLIVRVTSFVIFIDFIFKFSGAVDVEAATFESQTSIIWCQRKFLAQSKFFDSVIIILPAFLGRSAWIFKYQWSPVQSTRGQLSVLNHVEYYSASQLLFWEEMKELPEMFSFTQWRLAYD